MTQVGILPAPPAASVTPAAPNAYQTGAGLFGKAVDGLAPFEGGMLSNINDYINPYYDKVINNTLGRMGDERTKTLGQVGDAAQAAGAFGGARHGLMESDTIANYDRNMMEYVDRANADAFGAAGNMFNTDMMGQMALSNANTTLGNTYLGIGDRVQGQQAQYGQQQQAMMQQILQGNMGAWDSMTNSPYQIIDALNAMMGIDPRRGAGSGQESSTPGLFDYLSLGAQAMGGST